MGHEWHRSSEGGCPGGDRASQGPVLEGGSDDQDQLAREESETRREIGGLEGPLSYFMFVYIYIILFFCYFLILFIVVIILY